MSTCQHYEFLAIDRPLDERKQAEVRALSTRARITATSFLDYGRPCRSLRSPMIDTSGPLGIPGSGLDRTSDTPPS